MTLLHAAVLAVELAGATLLLLALVGVTIRILFIKSNAYTKARTTELPLIASLAMIWSLSWSVVNLTVYMIVGFVDHTLLIDGELPVYLYAPLLSMMGLGLAFFLATVVVRCWRLFLIFFVNQKIYQKLQAQADKTQQCMNSVPSMPITPELSPCQSGENVHFESKEDLQSPVSPQMPQEVPCKQQSWVARMLLFRTRSIKKMTKPYVTVPVTCVLAIFLFFVIIGRLPLGFFIDSEHSIFVPIDISAASIITVLVGIQALISAILLRKVDEVFNQSRELFMLLLVSLSAALTQVSHAIPFWTTAVHQVGIIMTGTLFLFTSGVYSLRQALRFRLVQLQNVVPSVEDVEEFLRQPVALQYFTTYIQHEYAVENLMFYLETRKFKELTAAGKIKESRKLGESILSRFFGSNAQFELNLPGPIADEVTERGHHYLKANETFPIDLFTQAEKVIVNSLAFDTFPRFKASSTYAELRQRLELEQHVINGML